MAVTILEALQNADYNMNSGIQMALASAKSQLHNAVTLLEKGYDLYDEVEPLLEKYSNVEAVPDKDSA